MLVPFVGVVHQHLNILVPGTRPPVSRSIPRGARVSQNSDQEAQRLYPAPRPLFAARHHQDLPHSVPHSGSFVSHRCGHR